MRDDDAQWKDIGKAGQSINRVFKDFVIFTAKYYGTGVLTALSEQEKGYTVDKEKVCPTHLTEEKETEHHSASEINKKEFPKEYMHVMAVANAAVSNDRGDLWLIQEIERLREEVEHIRESREQYVPSDMAIERPKFTFKDERRSIKSLETPDVGRGSPPLPPPRLAPETRPLPEPQPDPTEEKSTQAANNTVSSNETRNPHSPKWNRPFGAYSNAELRALKFKSVKELERAVKLCWHDPDLKGVPRGSPDGITLIVPEEAVQYFETALQSPNAKRPPFQVSKVLSPTDLPREKLAEMRRKYGM